MIRFRLLQGWAPALFSLAIVCSTLRAEAIEHAVPEGTLAIPLPTEDDGWHCTFPEKVGDLLFPDGVTLASMRQTKERGTMVTLSLDERHPTPAAEQAAFLALAKDREKAGRMAIWELNERTWIVQEFRSPSERVLAVQTFLGPYALGYLFWFAADGAPEEQAIQAQAILTRWHPVWRPKG